MQEKMRRRRRRVMAEALAIHVEGLSESLIQIAGDESTVTSFEDLLEVTDDVEIDRLVAAQMLVEVSDDRPWWLRALRRRRAVSARVEGVRKDVR